jgi:hypothetical protein
VIRLGKNILKVIFWSFVIAFLFRICSVENPYKPTWASALVDCEKAIKTQLKSPSTAKFSDIDGKNIALEDKEDRKKFRVIGWVDAQNSFGAMLREHYVCEWQAELKASKNSNSKVWHKKITFLKLL